MFVDRVFQGAVRYVYVVLAFRWMVTVGLTVVAGWGSVQCFKFENYAAGVVVAMAGVVLLVALWVSNRRWANRAGEFLAEVSRCRDDAVYSERLGWVFGSLVNKSWKV